MSRPKRVSFDPRLLPALMEATTEPKTGIDSVRVMASSILNSRFLLFMSSYMIFTISYKLLSYESFAPMTPATPFSAPKTARPVYLTNSKKPCATASLIRESSLDRAASL